MGVNLPGISYFTDAAPYLNVLAHCPGWQSGDNSNNNTPDNGLMPIDEFGNPTSVTYGTTTRVNAGVFVDTQAGPTYYKAGRYYLVYTGTGTFSFGDDAIQNVGASSPGRIALDVTPSNVGFRVRITSTAAAPNHLKIQYCCHEDDEQYILAGEYWSHEFIEAMKEQRVIRFMNPDHANFVTDRTWATRPKLSQIFWGTTTGSTYVYIGGARVPAGCPLEAMIDLCNRTRSDLWITMPLCATLADQLEYEANAATMVKQMLDPRLRVYRETWNEQWIGSTPVAVAAGVIGANHFQAGWTNFSYGFAYHLLVTVLGGNIWRGIWGAKGTTSGDRYFTVCGGQAANSGRTSYQLRFKCDGTGTGGDKPANEMYFAGPAGLYFDALAVAPYYWQDSKFPTAWANEADHGVDKMFTELTTGGLIPLSSAAITTGGTSTAYTLTSGQSLTARPPDQTILAITFHTTPGANATLAVDGGTTYSLKNIRGGSAYTAGGTRCFIFDRATDEWIACYPATGYSNVTHGNGELARCRGNMADQSSAIAASANPSIKLFVYECGGQLVDYSNDEPNIQPGMLAFQTDPRVYDATIDYLQDMKDKGVEVICYYHLVGRWEGQYGYWGAIQNIYDARNLTDTPKWQAITDFAVAQRTRSVSWN